jgi:hypothetical protein
MDIGASKKSPLCLQNTLIAGTTFLHGVCELVLLVDLAARVRRRSYAQNCEKNVQIALDANGGTV